MNPRMLIRRVTTRNMFRGPGDGSVSLYVAIAPHAASKPRSPVTHATFSGDPAEPTTLAAPSRRAIWPAAEPTAPAAPDTNTVSPSWTGAMRVRPTYAVIPGIPSTPRYADAGTRS